MVSFQKLWENMSASKMGDHADDKAMEAIRTGINVREDFWDDFLLVINNSTALSELLDIPTTKISSWHSKIKSALDKVNKADSTPEPKDKGKLMKTGMGDEQQIDPKISVDNQVQP